MAGTEMIAQFPHCDQRILHAPGECEFCDRHPEWQELRESWGIAFTGHPATERQIACPADHFRGPGTSGDHRLWGGNKPTSAVGDDSWPEETPASKMLYGHEDEKTDFDRRVLAALRRLARRQVIRFPW